MSAAQETEHSTDDTPLHATDSHNANADSCQDDTETGDIGKANDAYQANASTAGKAAEADNAAALNGLATRPVGALLWQYSVPAVAGMVVVSLYNVIDRIFIGRGVGPDAISGLAITFPLMNLSTALGVLVGAGASARVSIMLGAKRLREAQTILGNSLVMLLIFATIYITTFAVFLDPLLRAFGASDRTLPYAHDFMSVLLPGMLLMNLSFSLNNIQRASGYPRRAMMTMILSAVANAILAPIFIFGLDMGIRGAALATDLAMAGTLVFVLWHFFDRRSNLHFTSGTYRLRRTVVISIIGIGAAPSLVNAASSLINFLINNTMYAYGGDNAVGAAGIFSTYASLITMIIIGICQGMQPVVGYNYGAGKLHRLRRAYILTLAAATILSILGWCGAIFIPEAIASIFTTDADLVNATAHGLSLALPAFVFVGFQIVSTNFFQSIGRVGKSIFLGLSRQVLFLIPLLLIMPGMWGLNGVWLSFPIADLFATAVTVILIIMEFRRLRKMIPGRALS